MPFKILFINFFFLSLAASLEKPQFFSPNFTPEKDFKNDWFSSSQLQNTDPLFIQTEKYFLALLARLGADSNTQQARCVAYDFQEHGLCLINAQGNKADPSEKISTNGGMTTDFKKIDPITQSFLHVLVNPETNIATFIFKKLSLFSSLNEAAIRELIKNEFNEYTTTPSSNTNISMSKFQYEIINSYCNTYKHYFPPHLWPCKLPLDQILNSSECYQRFIDHAKSIKSSVTAAFFNSNREKIYLANRGKCFI